MVTGCYLKSKQRQRTRVLQKMSCKTNNSSSKSVCDHFTSHNCMYNSCKTDKMRCIPVKKVIPSRKLEPTSSSEVKSCSTGVINNKKLQVSKPRKITKSDIRFDSKKSVIDFCTKCGDSKREKNGSCKSFNSNGTSNRNDIETQVFIDQERRTKKVCEKKKMLQEYYKNENFKPSAKENNLKNSTLDPIKEGIEGRATVNNSSNSILETHSDSAEEIGFLDPEDNKNIKNIKNFRENNYFECHSAKARVSSKGSVTSLTDHKCFYRFYLNDRLFPVPINTDHRKNIRCIDCHLPLEVDSNLEDSESINGTIQAKVRIGNEIQDLTLMLPVKTPLIIREKRKLKDDRENDVLYFGIVKLNYNGDSIFNSTLPNDSLALRYQKGYKEFDNNARYRYEKVQDEDIIII